jgi:hypothetical protein
MIAERETDLEMKRIFKPRWNTTELLANVKGMSVISYELRLVPINRWTLLSYCSRWLGILLLRHACTLYLPSSRRYTCNKLLSFLTHRNKIKNDAIVITYLMVYIVHVSYDSFFICIRCIYEGMFFVTFVRKSLYPKGNNVPKDERL